MDNELKIINDDFAEMADDFVNYFNKQQKGPLRMDYSIESILITDECIDILRKQYSHYKSVENEIVAIGAYIGQIIKMNIGGHWTKYNLAGFDEKTASYDYVYRFDNGTSINLLGKVLKRFNEGEEHNLMTFYKVAEKMAKTNLEQTKKNVKQFQIGEEVIRYISSDKTEHVLKITEITDQFIFCGPLKFDKLTGAEIDEDLGWDNKGTGSHIDVFEK